MNQEVRTFLAIGLSLLVVVLWSHYFAPKPQPGQNSVTGTQQKTEKETEILPQTQAPKTPQDDQAGLEIQNTVVESNLYRVELTNDGGVPISWQMKNFKNGNGKEFIDLASSAAPPLFIRDISGTFGLPERPRFKLVEATRYKVVYLWHSDRVELTKTFQFNPERYALDVTVAIKNLSKDKLTGQLALEWTSEQPKEEKKGVLNFLKGPQNILSPVYYMDGKPSRDHVQDKEGRLYWAGVEDRYFLSAIIPRGHGDIAKVSTHVGKTESNVGVIRADVILPKIDLIPSAEAAQQFSVYVGAKDMDNLKNFGVSLERAIDYGWFSFIAVPILHLLKFFYRMIHNYGVAIILLTLFVKILLHPLSRHSMKSMKEMQLLQPRIKELREKYKDNRERLNAETMSLFKAHKVNPMGGCLPMVIQLPIYIALYKVLWNAIELYRAPFFWFYRDLSAPDPYFIMPVILGIAMWLQQKLTPSPSADPAQAKMMQIMPVMFTAFMLFLPSGLVFYILINTLFGVGQQWMMNHDIRLRDILRGRLHQEVKGRA